MSRDRRPIGAPEMAGVLAVLQPLGDADASAWPGTSVWSGTVARSGVGVAVVPQSEPGQPAEPRPALSADGQLIAVVDARIDNRVELATRLRIEKPQQVSNERLILEAYERWGRECTDHILGQFAFAVVDRRLGGLFLARDHLGSRPLVVHHRRGTVAFASNALALTGFDGVGHRLDVQHAKELLALDYSSGRTVVEGVSWVPAGSAMWIDDQAVRSWRWWRPEEITAVDLGSLDAHAEQLRHHLDLATSDCLRGAREPAVLLSGGLDSSSIAITAATSIGPRRLRTYTSVPPASFSAPWHPRFDPSEKWLVELMASRQANITPRFVDVVGLGLFECHEALWELGAGPLRNSMNAIWLHAIRQMAADDGVDVMLTGAFGNMGFSIDGSKWLMDELRRARVGRAARELLRWAGRDAQTPWSALSRTVLAHLQPTWLREVRSHRRPDRDVVDQWISATALRPEVLTPMDRASLLERIEELDDDRWGRHHAVRSAATATLTAAAHADHSAAAAALFGNVDRDPTADRRLLEVAFTQPERWRRDDGRSRAVVRRAMRGRLPDEVRLRERRGAQLPDWLDRLTDGRAEVDAEFRALREHPLSQELIDVERLDRLLETWPERERCVDRQTTMDYQLAMSRALLVSRYMRWFEGRATRSTTPEPVGSVSTA